MTVKFEKYQGAGNDFIMIDNRIPVGITKQHTSLIKRLCDRKFGIGADGLILLNDKPGYTFEMVYFNSDGNESTMCGNGGRCILRFAHELGLFDTRCTFWAIDGPHAGEITGVGMINIIMKDVEKLELCSADAVILNTGSPHYVNFVENAADTDVVKEGRAVRYGGRFFQDGINVNFAEKISDDALFVRTYERGVEDETLSCGTGVVASSLAFAARTGNRLRKVKVKTPGGNLEVSFEIAGEGYKDIHLTGPAERVYEGTIEI